MRHNLYLFRCDKRLTMQDMADLTEVSRVTYSLIESGERFGSAKFWDNLQSVFGVSDEDVRKFQKTEERENNK